MEQRPQLFPNKKSVTVFLILLTVAILDFGNLFGISNSTNSIITMLLGIGFVLIHGFMALGWRNLIVFLMFTIIISFAAEAIGVATGLVFGEYYYTDHFGPKLLGVPLLIQIAYSAMGYSSLMTARVILGFTSEAAANWKTLVAVTLVGTMIMVAWDVAMDPYQSTVAGDWIWKKGGPYFGIGIHNYIGWFVTVFTFMFLYQLYAHYYLEVTQTDVKQSKLFWSQPVIFYGLIGFGILLVPFIGGVSLPYASPNNYTGSLDSLVYSMALIVFFVMGLPVIIAITRLVTPSPFLTK